MKTHFRTRGNGAGQRAFTLIELIAVMGIMAILLAAIVPSISGVNESNNINQAGQTFADQVGLARQIAASKNTTVDVICMKLPTTSTVAVNGYNAILLWSVNSNSAAAHIAKLPDGVSISEDTTALSTLFSSYPAPTGAPQAGVPVVPPTTLPNGATNYKYFSVNPLGMLGPLSSANPVAPNMKTTQVVILPARSALLTSLTTVKNYSLVQVNPITAATLIYRP